MPTTNSSQKIQFKKFKTKKEYTYPDVDAYIERETDVQRKTFYEEQLLFSPSG